MSLILKSYIPQASIPVTPNSYSITPGATLSLTVSTGGTANHYQWFKGNTAVSGISSSPDFVKTNFTAADAGVYTCSVTSTIVTGLTLTITPVTVQLATPPPLVVVTALSPADNATGVALNTNLQATFSQDIARGTGSIALKRTDTDAVIESFDVATSTRVTINDATITIDPVADLPAGTGVYVHIPATAFKSAANGNFFSGITDKTTWNFTTAAAPPPPVTTARELPELTLPCTQGRFCIPLSATQPVNSGIMGIDYCFSYPSSVMTPTGNYTLGSVVTSGGTAIVNIDNSTAGQSLVSITYDNPTGKLTGSGEIICLEFELKPNVAMGDYALTSCGLVETYYPSGSSPVDVVVDVKPGVLRLVPDRKLTGKMIYRASTSTSIFNTSATAPQAKVFQATTACALSASFASPDAAGAFTMTMDAGNEAVSAERIIPQGTNVMNVINSADANLARSMVFNRHTASIYELIAADVNGSGMITSGDVGLILQRSTAQIPHFPGQPDWKFVDDVLLATTPFATATKNTVPQVPKCLALQKVTVNGCESFKEKVLQGILVGDVTGNWTAADAPNARMESAGEIIIDLSKAVALTENRYRVPVFCKSIEKVEAVDFELAHEKTLQVKAVQKVQGDEMQWNGSEDKLLLSAIHPGGTVADEPLYYLEVSAASAENLRFEATAGYLNGKAAEVSIKKSAAPIGKLMVYPNPVSGNTFRIAAPNVKLVSCEVINCTGRSVWKQSLDAAAAGVYEVAPEHLSKGTYFIKAVDAEGNVHHVKFTSL